MSGGSTRESFADFVVEINSLENEASLAAGEVALLSQDVQLPQIPYGPKGPAYAVEILAYEAFLPQVPKQEGNITQNVQIGVLTTLDQSDTEDSVINSLLIDDASTDLTMDYPDFVTQLAELERQNNIVDVDTIEVAGTKDTTVSITVSGTIEDLRYSQVDGSLPIGTNFPNLLPITTAGTSRVDYDVPITLSGSATIEYPLTLVQRVGTGDLSGASESYLTVNAVSQPAFVDLRDEFGRGYLTLSENMCYSRLVFNNTDAAISNSQWASFSILVYARYVEISRDELVTLAIKGTEM